MSYLSGIGRFRLPTAGSKTRGVDSTPIHGWQAKAPAKAPAPPCSDFLTNYVTARFTPWRRRWRRWGDRRERRHVDRFLYPACHVLQLFHG